MALTPEDVRNKQFSTAKRKGYEMDEVDSFLDQVELEIGGLARDNAELRGRVAGAEQAAAQAQAQVAAAVSAPAPMPVAPAAPDHNEQAVAMLALAQRTAEEHKSRAKAEADALLGDARAKVAEMERSGQAERATLERRVEELRAFEREYRTRLRQHHESALNDLEHRGTDPAAAAAPPAPPAPPVAPPAPPVPPPAPPTSAPIAAPAPAVAPPLPPGPPTAAPVAPPVAPSSPFAVPAADSPPAQA